MKNNNKKAVNSLRFQENDTKYHLNLIRECYTIYVGIAIVETAFKDHRRL
jgi:hypothetical protein